MADILLPPWLHHARTSIRYKDSTGVSVGEYTGAIITGSKGGDRLAASIEFTKQGGASTQMERAALIAFLARLRGKQNRAYLTDSANRRRGSFPATELLTNNTFANGATGWTASTGSALSVADRVMRLTALRSGANPGFSQVVSDAVQYAPYALRAVIMDGAQSAGLSFSAFMDNGVSGGVQAASTARGLITASGVNLSSSTLTHYPAQFDASIGYTAGAYISIPYASFTRCALIDNGANILLRSDELDNASWTKTNAAIGANLGTAPDGTATADLLREDATASTAHFVSQVGAVTSASVDISFTVALHASARTFAVIGLQQQAGGTLVQQYFNLATGAVGSGTTGANWSNRRVFVADIGSGWYACTIVARKTNAETNIIAYVQLATADGTGVYSGDNVSGIYVWRPTMAQSSVPTRLIQTTSAASTGASQTGSALHLKGLPASTSGLLLPNDQFEVITSRGSELKIVTAALSSDAAGLGYLQFEPPLRGVPADNAPVIIHEPMGRFIFTGDAPEWSSEPGIFTTASADFEEA